MKPKHKYEGRHPLQFALKLQWTPGAHPSSNKDYFKQNIAGWEEFQPKCLIEFVSKEEAKWGRGSCSACFEQFWQPPVWTTWVLLCFGARTWRLAGGCISTLHAFCHFSANPPKFGLVRNLLGWEGKIGENFSWPHINHALLENSRLDTQRDSYFQQLQFGSCTCLYRLQLCQIMKPLSPTCAHLFKSLSLLPISLLL